MDTCSSLSMDPECKYIHGDIFWNICVTEHIGSRNLNRLMAVEIKQTATRKNLQERRNDSGLRRREVVGSKSFLKEQTLSKSFKRRMHSIAKFAQLCCAHNSEN